MAEVQSVGDPILMSRPEGQFLRMLAWLRRTAERLERE
jgi:hypothetical protein